MTMNDSQHSSERGSSYLDDNTGLSVHSIGVELTSEPSGSFVSAENLHSILSEDINSNSSGSTSRTENDFTVFSRNPSSGNFEPESNFLQSEEALLENMAPMTEELTNFAEKIKYLSELSPNINQENLIDTSPSFVDRADEACKLFTENHNKFGDSLRPMNFPKATISMFMRWLENCGRFLFWFKCIDNLITVFESTNCSLNEDEVEDFRSYEKEMTDLCAFMKRTEENQNPSKLRFPISRAVVIDEISKKSDTMNVLKLQDEMEQKLKELKFKMPNILTQILTRFEDIIKKWKEQEDEYCAHLSRGSLTTTFSLMDLAKITNEFTVFQMNIQFLERFIRRLLFRLNAPRRRDTSTFNFNSMQQVFEDALEKTKRMEKYYRLENSVHEETRESANDAMDGRRSRLSTPISFLNIGNDVLTSTRLEENTPLFLRQRRPQSFIAYEVGDF